MRILVTGGNGQLGTCLRDIAANSVNEYVFTDVDDLDITDREAVMLSVKCNDFQAIVNCAAFTDVERAEDLEDVAEKINATAPGYLAEAAKECGIPLIHISTDYVFGGQLYNTPADETVATAPTGAYGRTKLHGEELIRRSGCRYIIIRTAWLYSEYGKNFVKTMLNLTAERPELKVVIDQAGTPTYARDLASAIVHIIDEALIDGHEGVYNFSNEGVCSWYDFAVVIADYGGHTGCDIRPCRSSEFPSKVIRPAYSVLDKSKIKETFGIKIPHWSTSLQTCVRNLTMAKI